MPRPSSQNCEESNTDCLCTVLHIRQVRGDSKKRGGAKEIEEEFEVVDSNEH